MRIVKIISLFLATLALADALYAQVPSARFKVRESGLFGLKGERYAKFELSTNNHALPLTDSSVNAGEYYYFLFCPTGDWALDADFVQEEIPKLTLLQNNQALQIVWKSDLGTDSAGTSIVVGFLKDLKLHLPFTVQFVLNGDSSRAEIEVPQIYWPGYTALTDALKDAEQAVGEKRYRNAITMYEHLMQTDSLQVFPQCGEFKDRRTQCFDGHINETLSAYQTITRGTTSRLKDKISQIDLLKW